MKRFITWVVICIIALCPVCNAEENWYLQEGKRLAERVFGLAADETYVQMYTASGEIRKVVSDFAKSDFSQIVEARMLSLPDAQSIERLLGLISTLSGEEIPEMSDAVKTEMFKQIPGMLVTMVNNRQGVSWVAATASVLRTSETYIMPEDFHPCVLLLEYPGEYAVAVAYTQTGEDTLTATATAVYSGFIGMISGELSLLERLAFEIMFPKIEIE